MLQYFAKRLFICHSTRARAKVKRQEKKCFRCIIGIQATDKPLIRNSSKHISLFTQFISTCQQRSYYMLSVGLLSLVSGVWVLCFHTLLLRCYFIMKFFLSYLRFAPSFLILRLNRWIGRHARRQQHGTTTTTGQQTHQHIKTTANRNERENKAIYQSHVNFYFNWF